MATRLGPVAVVTGASDGIGRATAAALAAEGFDLVLVARRGLVLEALAREFRAQFDVRCTVVAVDLGQRDGQMALSRALAGVDVGVLVAAAGYGTAGPFAGAALEEELDMLEVNCAAVCRVVHDVVPGMVARGRGAVVLLSSVVAFQGVPRAAHYAATKAYVQSFAEGLGAEVARHGVDVVALAPGPTESGFATRSRLAMGKAAAPDDVARLLVARLRRTGWRTVRPGFLAKLLGWSLAFLPRAGRTRVMGLVMGGMTKHLPDVGPSS